MPKDRNRESPKGCPSNKPMPRDGSQKPSTVTFDLERARAHQRDSGKSNVIPCLTPFIRR